MTKLFGPNLVAFKRILIAFIILVFIAIISRALVIDDRQAAKAEEVKRELIEIAKQRMDDPESFELVKFEHYPPSSRSTYFQVEMRYRGIGKSGREFIKTIKAHGDYAGKTLTIQIMPTGRPD